jgi:hypothetical protein
MGITCESDLVSLGAASLLAGTEKINQIELTRPNKATIAR